MRGVDPLRQGPPKPRLLIRRAITGSRLSMAVTTAAPRRRSQRKTHRSQNRGWLRRAPGCFQTQAPPADPRTERSFRTASAECALRRSPGAGVRSDWLSISAWELRACVARELSADLRRGCVPRQPLSETAFAQIRIQARGQFIDQCGMVVLHYLPPGQIVGGISRHHAAVHSYLNGKARARYCRDIRIGPCRKKT